MHCFDCALIYCAIIDINLFLNLAFCPTKPHADGGKIAYAWAHERTNGVLISNFRIEISMEFVELCATRDNAKQTHFG